MKNKLKSPADLFDALAENYETMRQEVAWNPFSHIREAVENMDLNGKSVLDAGCGTGECARWFQARGAHVVGIDISPEMCLTAAERSENILFLPHDLNEPLPFENNRFDLVVALGCLEYLPDIAPVVAEFSRVLKLDGLFLGCFERFGDDCPGKNARRVIMFDEWMRYRQSLRELQAALHPHFSSLRIDNVPGFILEETNEQTQYRRVIARKK